MFCLNAYLCTICVPGVREGQKRILAPQRRTYRRLWAAMWGLGIEPQSSERATHVPNHRASLQSCQLLGYCFSFSCVCLSHILLELLIGRFVFITVIIINMSFICEELPQVNMRLTLTNWISNAIKMLPVLPVSSESLFSQFILMPQCTRWDGGKSNK